jgi:phage/plasmid-like protein (TIGR03299 family)
MAHKVETMMYAGSVPWHGLGIAVEREVTSAAAIRLAGLDWECYKERIGVVSDKLVDGIPVVSHIIDDKFAVVRKSDKKYLGTVGSDYTVINNADCFGFLDNLIGSGQAVYHTAGSLFGGKIIFMTLKLPRDAKVGDDKIELYVLLSTSHDGTKSLNIRWTPVRVVCANTLNLALGKELLASINIRHTINYGERVTQAREVLGLASHYYDVMEKRYNKFLATKFNKDEMIKLSKQLLPFRDDPKSKPIIFRREKLVELFTTGKGNEAVKDTAWAAFNAATEYADHHKQFIENENRSREEARLQSITSGSAARFKQQAYNLLAYFVDV